LKFGKPLAAKSVAYKQAVGVIVALTALVWGGVASADSAQDTLAKFKELSRQAEDLAAKMNAAQKDLDTKLQLLGEADKRQSDDLARLDAARAQLTGYQQTADKIAAAAYMGGRADELNAILTAASPTSLIDDLSVHRAMGIQMTGQMQSFRRADQEARTLAAASAQSAVDAKAAMAAAAAVRSDLQNQQAELQTQVTEAKAEFALLASAQQSVLTAMPASVVAALGPIRPIPTVGMGGLVPNARGLAAYIMATYPGVRSIGGVRPDPLPDHPSGRAIDIMLSDMGLGDVINADIQRQAGRFGVSYTMWRVPAHFDHIHVTVN
jgi:hypothetical protein